MKKIILLVFLLAFAFLPLVSADIIEPGYKYIPIYNYITNINDFPDYAFISTGSLGPDMCPVKVIDSSGKIESYYKFCGVSVYAIKKSELKEEDLENLSRENFEAFFSNNTIKVIGDLQTSKYIPVSSTENSITNYYIVDLDKLKISPDSKTIGRNWLFYFYIIIPIIALIIIGLIIWKRKNVASA